MACYYYNEEKNSLMSGIYCDKIGGRPGNEFWRSYCQYNCSRCPYNGGDDPDELLPETRRRREAREAEERRKKEEEERRRRQEEEEERRRRQEEEEERRRRQEKEAQRLASQQKTSISSYCDDSFDDDGLTISDKWEDYVPSPRYRRKLRDKFFDLFDPHLRDASVWRILARIGWGVTAYYIWNGGILIASRAIAITLSIFMVSQLVSLVCAYILTDNRPVRVACWCTVWGSAAICGVLAYFNWSIALFKAFFWALGFLPLTLLLLWVIIKGLSDCL